MDSAGNNPVQSPNDKSTGDYEEPTNRSSVSSETSIRGIEDENDKVTNAAAYQEKEQKVTNGHAVEHDGNNVDANEHKGAQLEPIKSKQPSVRDASSIPDGGLASWLQVLGAFFLFFNSWGVINTFGSYQAYYEEELLSTSTASAISWIGSIQAFLLLVVGAMTGPLYDAGYFRALLVVGTVFLVLGQMMIGLCNAYWQVLLCQAFCIGIGTGMLFIPSVAILSTYFTTRIGTAMGLAASGSSFGGVIYPIVFHKLLPQIGFGWTTRVIGFIILGTMLIPNVCMRVRVLPAKSRSLLDLSAFKLPPYSLQVAGFFIGFMGLYMPFFYAQLYAIQEQITNPDLAFYLLAILNSTSTFGRIIPNFFADKVGPFNVVIPCTVISGILCYCFIAARVSAGLIALMAFYGFFSGSFVSLPPTIIVHLSLNARDKIGTRLGQSFAAIAIGMLIGTPIGGTILDHHGFDSIWIYGGSMLMGSTVLLIAGRIMHKGWGFTVKA